MKRRMSKTSEFGVSSFECDQGNGQDKCVECVIEAPGGKWHGRMTSMFGMRGIGRGMAWSQVSPMD